MKPAAALISAFFWLVPSARSRSRSGAPMWSWLRSPACGSRWRFRVLVS